MKEQLKTLQLIHWMLLIPIVIFSIIVIYLNMSGSGGGELDELNQVFLYLPGLLLIVALPSSTFIFNQSIKGIDKNWDLKLKMSAFQKAHLIRMALFETVGLIALVASFVTGTYYNLAILAIILIVFVFNKPTPFKIESVLGLDASEREQLKQKDS